MRAATSPVSNKMKLPGQVQQTFWKLHGPWRWDRGCVAIAFECSLNTQQQAKESRVTAAFKRHYVYAVRTDWKIAPILQLSGHKTASRANYISTQHQLFLRFSCCRCGKHFPIALAIVIGGKCTKISWHWMLDNKIDIRIDNEFKVPPLPHSPFFPSE